MHGALLRLTALSSWLRSLDDVLRERVVRPEAPAWCQARGWTAFLRSLSDEDLTRSERDGPAELLIEHPRTPSDLRTLAVDAGSFTRVDGASAPPAKPLRRASPRKSEQVEALAALAPTGATRIIDFGSGHGHLTRRLAAALDLPAIGLERREASVRSAREIDPDPRVRFEVVDVDDVDAGPDDLLVGLHACGDLGDSLARCAARTGAAAMLVSCCPQKTRSDPRAPLSSAGLSFDRSMLGLANLAATGIGLVTSEDAMERRRRRYALRCLLEEAGVSVAAGEETRGINRKRFARPLEAVVGPAFERRGLPSPSDEAIRDANRRSVLEHALIRRFALPRTLIARPLELALVLDRAGMLEDAGRAPRVVEAFPRSTSPRNLALIVER